MAPLLLLLSHGLSFVFLSISFLSLLILMPPARILLLRQPFPLQIWKSQMAAAYQPAYPLNKSLFLNYISWQISKALSHLSLHQWMQYSLLIMGTHPIFLILRNMRPPLLSI